MLLYLKHFYKDRFTTDEARVNHLFTESVAIGLVVQQRWVEIKFVSVSSSNYNWQITSTYQCWSKTVEGIGKIEYQWLKLTVTQLADLT